MSAYTNFTKEAIEIGIKEDEHNVKYFQECKDNCARRITEMQAELKRREDLPFSKDLAEEFGVFVGNTKQAAAEKRLLVAIFEDVGYAKAWADLPGMYKGRWVIRQRLHGSWGAIVRSCE